ncbi:HEAT repeat domain-containing protein [Peribacillus sp. SCS-155]|uniref:HEAT repeat domain-containing protein n=1 Tax=Peribacillus sedimenti TaxID=3115297 RepID=UPI003906BEE4
MLGNEILLLGCATLLLLSLLLLMLIYLVIRKTLEIKNRRTIDELKDEYNSILFQYIYSGTLSREIQADTILKQKAVEETLAGFSEVLEEKAMNERLSYLAEKHLGKPYASRLKKRNWSIRMNTLSYVESFQMKSLLSYIINILEKPSATPDEKILCLRIMGSFQDPRLMEYLNNFTFLSDSDYRSILLRLSEKNFDICVLGYHQSNDQLKLALLDVIGIKKDLNYVSFLNDIFRESDHEERVRSLKAIANIGYIKDPESIIPLSTSKRWEERMIAARIFGILKSKPLIPILITLLHDSNWWVRSEAGAALTAFPDGKVVLEDISKTDEDRFARDMAWEWLHKGVI